MGEKRRGPAPGDEALFGETAWPALRTATEELSWLRGRGYAEPSAVALVGNRHQLAKRQRRAVSRAACSDAERAARQGRRVGLEALAGAALHVDGFNALITAESVRAGAPVFLGRDGALRDLASVHGSWRRGARTEAALDALEAQLRVAAPARVVWWLDAPVSNSGRLAGELRERAEAAGLPWEVRLDPDPDARLVALEQGVAASADARILDGAPAWVDLPAAVLAEMPDAWLVDLRDGA